MSKSIQQQAPPTFESIFDGNNHALKPAILDLIPVKFHPEIATIVSIVLEDASPPDANEKSRSLRKQRLLDMQYAVKKEAASAPELPKEEIVMRILWAQADRRRAIDYALAQHNDPNSTEALPQPTA